MSDKDKPDFLAKKHVAFFKRTLAVLPGSLAALDSMRMTILFFALSGLDVLDALSEVDCLRADIIKWIYTLQIYSDGTEDTKPKCGFKGSTMLCGNSSSSSKSSVCGPYDCSHVTMTYTALCSLLILGDDLGGIDKQAILHATRQLQLEDGSFFSTIDGSENDMRFLYCAACVCFILDDWSGMDKDRAVRYIRSSQTYEGGVGQGPGQEAHGGSTFCAVAALALMNRLEEAFDADQMKTLRRWTILRQQTGFHSRPNKPEDTCYSFWCGAALKLMDMFHMTNLEFNRSFLLETQDEVIGGFSKWPDNTPDALHSYLALSGLSFMNEEGLVPVHPALNITERTVQHLLRLHQQWKVS